MSPVRPGHAALSGLPFDATDDGQVSSFRRNNLGRRLASASEAFERLIRFHLDSVGLIENLSGIHVAAARSIDLEGTRMSELAQRVGISKQYVGTVVRELRDAGIVRIEPDPDDGRARLVKFTASGRAGLLVGLQTIARVTQATEEAVGAARLEEFRKTLEQLRSIWAEQMAGTAEEPRA